jgi:hypothetical protein
MLGMGVRHIAMEKEPCLTHASPRGWDLVLHISFVLGGGLKPNQMGALGGLSR